MLSAYVKKKLAARSARVLNMSVSDYGEHVAAALRQKQTEIKPCPSQDKGKAVSVAILAVYGAWCLFVGEVL